MIHCGSTRHKTHFCTQTWTQTIGCHVVCLSQKPSQGTHMNFMWALIFSHINFCEVGNMNMQGLKYHHFVIVWALCVCFVQPMSFFFLKELCEHMFMWGQKESKLGERGSWFKSMFGAWKEKLVQGTNVFGAHLPCYSIFLKIPTLKLWAANGGGGPHALVCPYQSL